MIETPESTVPSEYTDSRPQRPRPAWRSTAQRYGIVAQCFHWLIVALVFTQFGLGVYGADLPLGFDKLVVLARHKSVGITIFAIAALRLAWRWRSPPPPLPAHMRGRERALAHASHGLLYALLFLMPVTGWLFSSATGISVSWFGVVALPDLVAENESLAAILLTTHIALAVLLAATVAGHVAAAFWHHFVKRDTVLLRMLPGSHARVEAPDETVAPVTARPRRRRLRTR